MDELLAVIVSLGASLIYPIGSFPVDFFNVKMTVAKNTGRVFGIATGFFGTFAALEAFRRLPFGSIDSKDLVGIGSIAGIAVGSYVISRCIACRLSDPYKNAFKGSMKIPFTFGMGFATCLSARNIYVGHKINRLLEEYTLAM